ncbi:hypothetical protein Pst134EB_008333 [Puccinia striiformis f. sp. tritici]|nr:hypothetical protein Pst134EB_008333 [Puccinia striiformis f. sp. tritici]
MEFLDTSMLDDEYGDFDDSQESRLGPSPPVPGQRQFMPLFDFNTQGEATSGPFDTQGNPINPGYLDPAQALFGAGLMALHGLQHLPDQSQTQLGWHTPSQQAAPDLSQTQRGWLSPSQGAAQSSHAAIHSMLHGSQYPNQGQTSRPSHTSTHLAHESPAQPNAHVIPGHTNHSTQATSQNPAIISKRRVPVPAVTGRTQRLVTIDWSLFSRGVLAEVLQAIGGCKTRGPKKKVWEPILPGKTETLPVWYTDLAQHTWTQFQQGVVDKLGTAHSLLVRLLQDPEIIPLVKWQLGLSSHPKFAPAKKFYAASEAHFLKFTQQVMENVNSHITVKLIMNDPGQVLKDAINSSTQNRSLTLIYGDPVARAALEREEARLAINPKAHISSNPHAPIVAQIVKRITEKFGRNNEELWMGHPEDPSKGMHMHNARLNTWARAIHHGHNPEIDPEHPPQTDDFNWINQAIPTLEEKMAHARIHGNKSKSGQRQVQSPGGEGTPSKYEPKLSDEKQPKPPRNRLIDQLDSPESVSDIEIIDTSSRSILISPPSTSWQSSPARKYLRSPSTNMLGGISKLSFA